MLRKAHAGDVTPDESQISETLSSAFLEVMCIDTLRIEGLNILQSLANTKTRLKLVCRIPLIHLFF